MTILAFDTTLSADSRAGDTRARGVATTALHDSLWRVTRPDGDVLGYIERFTETRGIRFRAKRLIVRQQRFVPVGEFWSMDDALECFRVG